jgi:hypothetical protein
MEADSTNGGRWAVTIGGGRFNATVIRSGGTVRNAVTHFSRCIHALEFAFTFFILYPDTVTISMAAIGIIAG